MIRTFLYTFAFFATLAYNNQLQAQNRQIAEQVVAVVGNSMIMLSDVDDMAKSISDERKKQGYTSDRDPKCEALESLLMQKMLANQARLDSLETNSSMIDSYIQNHIMALTEKFGSMKALETAYRKPVYQLKDELRNRYMDMQLANVMEDNIKSKVSIIPSEVEKYFRALDKDSLPMIPEQYVYSQIIMYPASSAEAKLRTKEKLLEMRERIIKGAKFAVLARSYSSDQSSAIRGGEMEPMPKHAFVTPFGDAMEKLKPGQISDIVETEFGFHIIELIEKKGENYRVRHILLRPEYTNEELLINTHKLDSIVNVIRKDSLTFEKAVEKFSQDPLSKSNHGIVTNHEYVEFNQLQAKNASTRFFKDNIGNDYNIIKNMKVGNIADSYQSTDVRGNELSKVIKLNEIIPSHRANIKEDYVKIEEMALEAKKEKVYKEWLKKKMEAMYIRIDPRFVNCEFETGGWVK